MSNPQLPAHSTQFDGGWAEGLLWLFLFLGYLSALGCGSLFLVGGLGFTSGAEAVAVVFFLTVGATSMAAATGLGIAVRNTGRKFLNRGKWQWIGKVSRWALHGLWLMPLAFVLAGLALAPKSAESNQPGMIGGASQEEMIPVGITGIDHLPAHLAVQSLSVDGSGGGSAGTGSLACCASLPALWRKSLVVEIRWGVTNFRDCKADEYVARVPVEQYSEVGNLFVHFFADGKVRAVSSNYNPAGARHPESEYPIKTPIPDKDPWHRYSLESTCLGKDREAPPTQHKEGDVSYE
ncbi:DUF3304 domain-containing protein [Lysobacter koreensis]|uniref:DUF3304 domain-containing protein n=1 Tax=Lysobacter koreensis TaxID=266122 RepID=A0ABW2YQP0_9GAMM